MEQAQQHFETNPLYWLLHEAIYCDANAKEPAARGPSDWAAERVHASLGAEWQHEKNLKPGDPPVLFTGEMVYPWMGDDFSWLRPLKPAADLLASKADWGPLYDPNPSPSPNPNPNPNTNPNPEYFAYFHLRNSPTLSLAVFSKN